jgi:hypothetical protein
MQVAPDYYLTPFEVDSMTRDIKMIDVTEYGSSE